MKRLLITLLVLAIVILAAITTRPTGDAADLPPADRARTAAQP